MRVLHFSDIHIGVPFRQVPIGKWISKRAIGGLNLLLGRQRHFDEARAKLVGLANFKERHDIDLVICTGDYTGLGLDRELAAARAAVEPLMNAPLGFVTVPGNHDLYVSDVIRERCFERHFGDTLGSDLTEYQVDGPWPLVRLVGDEVAVVAVNSAHPNPVWRSSGHIPANQLAMLQELLRAPRIRKRYVFIITHYPPRLSDSRHDQHHRRLLNADAFLAACADLPRGAILCGHVHHCFHLRLAQVNPPIFCSGSTTMAHREGLWVFDIGGDSVRATPGRWDGQGYVLTHDAAVDGG
jgi:3',5'-cyclic AMP phosphodiesterase CpdA